MSGINDTNDESEQKPYDPNPSSVANNRHHEGGYRSEDDWLKAEHGMVIEPGNPDNVGYYPNSPEDPRTNDEVNDAD